MKVAFLDGFGRDRDWALLKVMEAEAFADFPDEPAVLGHAVVGAGIVPRPFPGVIFIGVASDNLGGTFDPRTVIKLEEKGRGVLIETLPGDGLEPPAGFEGFLFLVVLFACFGKELIGLVRKFLSCL